MGLVSSSTTSPAAEEVADIEQPPPLPKRPTSSSPNLEAPKPPVVDSGPADPDIFEDPSDEEYFEVPPEPQIQQEASSITLSKLPLES